LDERTRLAEALHYRAFALFGEGQTEEACAFYEAHATFIRQYADPMILALALALWGNSLMRARGDFATAKTLLEESLAIGKRQKDPHATQFSYMLLGFWAMQQGDYTTAMHYQQEALTWQRQTVGRRGQGAVAMRNMADIARLQGDHAQARLWYNEALALLRASGDHGRAAGVLVGLGYLAVQQGDLEQAATRCTEGLSILQTQGEQARSDGIAYYLAGYAELRRAQGRVTQAVCLLASDALRPVARGYTLPVSRIDYERTLAAARAQLSEADFNGAWEAGKALTVEEAMTLALSEAEPITATTSTSLSDKPQMFGLTPRSREVALLVAEGLSNREIAEKLVLGERTVESHVSNIFNKLGFTRRAEVRRWVKEKGLK
jgi:non-specific serine/threonine protein kinase